MCSVESLLDVIKLTQKVAKTNGRKAPSKIDTNERRNKFRCQNVPQGLRNVLLIYFFFKPVIYFGFS